MISLSEDQIDKLYDLADLVKPAEVAKDDVTKLLIELEKKVSISSYAKSDLHGESVPSILVVDDLELSIHQLSILLSKSGYNVYIARTKEEAEHLCKQNTFDYVLVDLFIPDYEDGLSLIDFICSSQKSKENNTKTVVISGTEDKNLVNKCFLKGANEFIGKSPEWHKNILQYIRHCENAKSTEKVDITTEVLDENDKILSISISNINKPSVVNELEKEIVAQVNSGYSNIILDMQRVNHIDSSHTAIFIMGYKECSKNGGMLYLCNISKEVGETLSYVYLDNIISIAKNKDEAVNSIKANLV